MRINLKVDIDVQLLRIIGVEPDWETEHEVRALSINGRSPALAALDEMARSDLAEYKRITRAIRLVASTSRVTNPNCVKADAKGRGVYEMRGLDARLFFFYSDGKVVVCTNLFKKNKGGSKEQDKAFAQCKEMRDIYEAAKRG